MSWQVGLPCSLELSFLQTASPRNSSHAQSLFPAHLPFLSLPVPAVGWIHLASSQGFCETCCYCIFKCLVPGKMFLLSFIPSTLTEETVGRCPRCLLRCSHLSADHRNASRPPLHKLGTFLGSLRNQHKNLRVSSPGNLRAADS